MSDTSSDARYLEMFPSWLRALGEDTAALGEVLRGGPSDPVKRFVVAALNYLFKSLDLIPDGIDDLGFLDDAFVLRVSAGLAVAEGAAAKEGVLGRLADDVTPIRDFLGSDFARLEGYVKNLRRGAARGRTVDDIVTDAAMEHAFLEEIDTWSKAFQPPTFTRDPKTLIKLRAFLSAKLP